MREVGYRVPAPVAAESTEPLPEIASQPLSSRESRGPSRSLSWWSEMPLLDGGVCVRVTSDSHALMPKLFASMLLMLFGAGFTATLIGSREAAPPPFLVLLALGCAVGGGITLGRGMWRLGQTATFSFRSAEVTYSAGTASRTLPTSAVLRFRARMTDLAAGSARTTERVYTVEIVTATEVVVVPLALTGEERVHALTARLDSLLRDAQAARDNALSAFPRPRDASSHPAAQSPPS